MARSDHRALGSFLGTEHKLGATVLRSWYSYLHGTLWCHLDWDALRAKWGADGLK